MKTILVAVKDPGARGQPGVGKALDIARSLGASVELFHALTTPVMIDLAPVGGKSLAATNRALRERQVKRLEAIAARAKRPEVKVTCHAQWDFPAHEAIVRRARRIGADLVIAQCHVGRRTAPWLLHLTDWELLRLCPVPVLLLRSAKPWDRPRLVAAVDPTHARDKPAKLDKAIVTQASQLARKLRGSLDVVHVNFPASLGPLFMDPYASASVAAKILADQQKLTAARFRRFCDAAGVPRDARHLVTGNPVDALPEFASRRRADVVVMGAVSRSGLKRVLIGNTAEHVLARMPCDVLVVKPARQKSRVQRRTRGMRIIPPEPLMPLPV